MFAQNKSNVTIQQNPSMDSMAHETKIFENTI